ncbi:retrovirus-related Pol polyprotein from transposon 17.6 [Trichonephila clavipes]|nr:retrovirus-related Pol polyprotein from transposon 17.6 [Trichonephila clavipes]
MVVDTGANVSIIRKDLAQNLKLSIIWKPSCIFLQTVTGDKIQVHGKANVTLRRTRLTKHRIDTGEHPPIKQHPRRLPFAKQEEVQKLIKDMKNNDVIEPSSSPWASPIVLVRKKDGSTRFCVDYRRLNDVIKKDSYPLPRIDDTLDTLAGNTWFSTLDLKSRYWQLELHPDDKEKTAFTTGQALWQFKVMSFGLCNAPATFERLQETVLGGLSYEACLVYLDDIIIVGWCSFEEHLKNIRRVLQKLKEANPREVTYLGHIISAEGVRTDPVKISAVKDWNCPTDVHQLQSLLGLCTYYRKFVKNFSTIARPLYKLTEVKQKFIWTVDCNSAFNKLKDALTSAPVLAYPEIGKQFILDTDASHESIGAVLSQDIDGQERVTAYLSKRLSKPEINYCVTRKELLAIEYDVEIRHRKESAHGNADALSRRPCPESCKYCSRIEKKFGVRNPIVHQVTAPSTSALDPWSDESVRKDQLADPEIKPIIEFKESSDEKPSWQDIAPFHLTMKRYWVLCDSLHLRNGVLYRKWESDDGKIFRWQLILPKTRVSTVLKELHGSPTGGHFGVMKTLQKVR